MILNKNTLVLAVIGSAAIGVGISFAEIYLFHFLLIILGFFGFFKLSKSNYLFDISLFSNKNILFLLIMFIWYLVSIIWSPSLSFSLKYLFYLFCGITITILVVQFSNSKKKLDSLFNLLSIIFSIELVIALMESFTSFRWPISPYSSWHSFFRKDSVDFFTYSNPLFYSQFQPPTGFHWNTNNLAITMLMILPFFLCSKKLQINIIGSISISLIIFFSSSRAVFLGLVLVYSFYLLFIKKQVRTLSLIWIIISSLFIGINNLQNSLNPRVNEIANSFNAVQLYLKGDLDIGGSLEWRRELINDGIVHLKKSKGIGVGAGGSTALQNELGGVAGRFTSMHNFWVEILVEGGVFIALLLLLWYLKLIYNLFLVSRNNSKRNIRYYSNSLILSMIAFLPAAVAASSTIYFFPMWIMFGLSIAVIRLGNNSVDFII